MSFMPKISLRFLLRMRPILRWLTKLRSSPRAIAGGFALGTFIAFTPTLGVQIILAIFFATLFNCNRAAAIIPVWLTNPVTVAPIFSFNYYIGQHIWGGPPVSEVYELFLGIGSTMAQLDFWGSTLLLQEVIQLGPHLVIPLCLGSFIVGSILTILVYIPMLRILTFLARRKREKKILY
ncbi:DUF2062 domain-containing protein [Desulfotalea psychrophila]|uniref:Hypothetical membrane protein n=1 Tax=Desulfotalea psychrophila (strain LSv54 / DSM 12343) TaxID=177439 RepID=Q6AQM2_DESPS|nr:DUF2062 domain-containing protein [Desulfotalea psychrophila]CAG35351.1 hypothetical membrane protein [Desulfotalea psychrophila LSv54]